VAVRAGLVAVAGAAALRGRSRHLVWLAAGALLVGTATWGLGQFDAAVEARRAIAFQEAIAPSIADPRPNQDADRLRQLSDEAMTRPVTVSVELAREAGVLVRRLPYGGAALGLSAFLTLVVGIAALLFGLRVWPRAGRALDRVLTAVAIPAVSIALALLAAAVVILVLQPTPMGRDVAVTGPVMVLAGRLDTLWHAYYLLFSGSLSTVKGFFDALSFATPLIFTGLAVSSASGPACSTSAPPARWCWARSARCSSVCTCPVRRGSCCPWRCSRRRSAAACGAPSPGSSRRASAPTRSSTRSCSTSWPRR
jgi:hypothetical protein